MYGRALALGIGLFVASAVQAQVVEVVLLPQSAGPYDQGDVVMVDVVLSRVASGNALPVRLLQFDTSVSDPALTLSLPLTHELDFGFGDDISFWWFVRQPPTALCNTFDSLTGCGQNYYIEDDLGGARPGVISVAYLGLSENSIEEMFIPGDSASSVKLGVIEVTMPDVDGTYTLDLMNATEGDADVGGAELHASHSLPLTPFRAFDGSLSGGTVDLEVGGGCDQLANIDFPALDATEYPCDASLSREGNNILRIPFDIAVAAPAPGEIEVRELMAGGAFGPDIAATLTITVENGNILTLTEAGQVLTNGKWYGILNTGAWCAAGNFEVDYAVVYGDANNTLGTGFTDLSAVRANFADPGNFPDNSRHDINTAGSIGFTDMSAARADFTASNVVKPTGHGCSP